MVALQRPEQEVNHRAKYAPVNLAFALTQPRTRTQRFVWIAAQQRIDELVQGDEDIQDVAQHLPHRACNDLRGPPISQDANRCKVRQSVLRRLQRQVNIG